MTYEKNQTINQKKEISDAKLKAVCAEGENSEYDELLEMQAIRQKAKVTIAHQDRLILNEEESDFFIELLLNSPPPNEALFRAAYECKKNFENKNTK